MKEENLFLVCVATVVTVLVVSLTAHNIHEDYLVSRAIESGVDPISARCGFDPLSDICIINETQSK